MLVQTALSGELKGQILFLIVFSGLKDEMLDESENLPDPNALATGIVEDHKYLTKVGPT